MQTSIHPDLAGEPLVDEADRILRKCVHCGFCTATCPTYQLLGDELDGPRGRIYLIKNLLEENTIDEASAAHLDRCLTCRSCETTCPSGVAYGRLLDIGRYYAGERVQAPPGRRLMSGILRFVIPKRYLFSPLLRLGQIVRPLLPVFLKRHVPRKSRTLDVGNLSPAGQGRVLLLTGCVQSAATPNVVKALQKILASQGIATELVNEGCCGALDYHLAAHDAGVRRMKKVVDLLHERLDGVDAIVSSATGCGVTIREYPEVLKGDRAYADKAAELVEKVRDPVELIEVTEVSNSDTRVAVHTPCSMQHGMKMKGQVEQLLAGFGYEQVPHEGGHLCCGSAGTYSILQPDLSHRLREQKLGQLNAAKPDVIVTANVGCQLHLQDDDGTPVRHWLELVAEGL